MWWIIWLVIGILCVILEAATPQLTSVWFAAGALAALIVSLFTPPSLWWLQLLVFIAVSAVAVAITRPLARRFLEKNKARVNADRFIGADGVVVEDIDNIQGKGQVKSSNAQLSILFRYYCITKRSNLQRPIVKQFGIW